MIASKNSELDVTLLRGGRELHAPVVSEGAESFSPDGVKESVVEYLGKDSPAEKAGLQPGDRIVAAHGRRRVFILDQLRVVDSERMLR